MKKLIYLVIILIGVGIIMNGCSGGGNKSRQATDNALVEETNDDDIISVGDEVYSCAYDGFVNMRNEPSYSATKVGKFNNGMSARVIGEQGEEWKQIDVSGSIGWVPVKYLQIQPTIAYTGNVDVNWIEGAWGSEEGYVLFIHNNGTYSRGYDYDSEHGKYIMQNNEVKCIPTWTFDGEPTNISIYEIDERSGELGGYKRIPFLTQSEVEEAGEDFAWELGYMTKTDFRNVGNALLAEVEKEKPLVVGNVVYYAQSMRKTQRFTPQPLSIEEINNRAKTMGSFSAFENSFKFGFAFVSAENADGYFFFPENKKALMLSVHNGQIKTEGIAQYKVDGNKVMVGYNMPDTRSSTLWSFSEIAHFEPAVGTNGFCLVSNGIEYHAKMFTEEYANQLYSNYFDLPVDVIYLDEVDPNTNPAAIQGRLQREAIDKMKQLEHTIDPRERQRINNEIDQLRRQAN